jgi:hypothetical protein
MKGKTIFNIFLMLFLFTAFVLALPCAAMAAEPETPAESEPAQGIAAEVVETEAGIYYTIKEGDTLWDLSRKFADSPYLWPDLWSENSKIANPHRIYPGERIQLYRRTDTTVKHAPVVEEVVEAKAPVLEMEPETEPEPLPPVEEQPEPAQDSGVLTYSRVNQVGFIREIPVKPHGKIFKVQGFKEMIATDDVIYIIRDGDRFLVPGKRYTIYRTPNKVWDRKTEEYIGTQHYLLGIAEITQVEPDYAIGKVVRAYSNIRIGDLLMPFERRTAKINRRNAPPGLTGEIIMAEQQNLIIGDHVIAFINRGRRDGVEIGHVFNVYFQESGQVRSSKRDKIVLQPVVFGEFVVLLTEETTSTVYVTDARQNISQGTKFRAPVR